MSRKLFTNFTWGLTGEPQQMLVENGKVVSRAAQIQTDSGPVDLGGKFLLPAFIDSHCHILPTGLDLSALFLGDCLTKEAMFEAILERHRTLEPGKWLHAVHYDQNRLPGGNHLTRDEIDVVVADRPVLLEHWNGHASVTNSEALRLAGVREDTPDPRGGTYVRDASGRATGVLLETAHEAVAGAMPQPNLEEMVEAILAAAREMAKLGITCASDMMTGFMDLKTELEAYRIALERGCPIRIRLYLQWACVLGKRAVPKEIFEDFTNRTPQDKGKIAGLKIFADGAIGSATAGIYGRFLTTEGDQKDDGKLIYAPERLNDMVRQGHDHGYAISVHSIGDRSTDHVMDAFAATDDPSRHRLEHAMLLSDAQIERLARLGCFVNMQPEFLKHFGHAYLRQLGAERLRPMKRFKSLITAGIPLALSSDRPITPGRPWDGIHTAEDRPEIFDPCENLTRAEALAGYLSEASKCNGDGDRMGTLEPGSVADFCLYEQDPLTATDPKIESVWMSGEGSPV